VLFGTFFTSQSIVSYASVLSSIPGGPARGGRFMSNRPRAEANADVAEDDDVTVQAELLGTAREADRAVGV